GRVVGGRVRHAEGLAEDDDGEEVVLGLLLSFERLPVGADVELEQSLPECRPLLGQRPETAGDLLCDAAWHGGIRRSLASPPACRPRGGLRLVPDRPDASRGMPRWRPRCWR